MTKTIGVFVENPKAIGGGQQKNIVYHLLQDIYFDKGFRYIKNKKLLKTFDYYRFNGNTSPLLYALAYKYLYLENKKCIDPRKKFLLSKDKLSQLVFLHHENIMHPESIYFSISQKYHDIQHRILQDKFSFPFIAKDVNGARGDDVYLIKNNNELRNFLLNNNGRNFIFQEYIKNMGDIRVVTVGSTYVGAMKRYNPNDFRNNTSKGGIASQYHIDRHTQKECLQIAKKFGLHVMGLDLIKTEKGYSVIEINDIPDNEPFSSIHNIDMGEIILENLINNT